jgi:NADPH:quinone reductase-like Zn-dependent oxidoreductase
MRAIEAKTFSGYGGLRQTELPKPQPAKDRVLVRVTAAGVTPLEYTVLSGGHPRAKAPLVLGNEGAGVIEDAGDSGLAVGSRVMFTDLIWKRARMAGFSLFAQSPTAIATAWQDVIPLMVTGSVKPIVERVYTLPEAAAALRHLIEDRPFGKVVSKG